MLYSDFQVDATTFRSVIEAELYEFKIRTETDLTTRQNHWHVHAFVSQRVQKVIRNLVVFLRILK